MESLIVKSYNSSLQDYELNWIEKTLNNKNLINEYRNPTLSLYISMVYGFAEHLPYSIDIEQPEYVPADFLNMIPKDVDTNQWFKWDDRRTVFYSMINWGDTFKSGMLLQLCNVFQKMILGEFTHDFVLNEEDFLKMGFDSLTKNQEYNRCFFETLKSLPNHYNKVMSATNNDERRKALEDMYKEVMTKISARYGGFRERDADGNIIRESKVTIPIRPSKDVDMLVYWDDVTFHDGIPSLIEEIKKEQMKQYQNKKDDSSKALPEANSTPKLKQLKY